jgi:thioredoxin-related protein
MKKILIPLLILFQLNLLAAQTSFAQRMGYHTLYKEALQVSIEQNKPLMLVVGTNTCPWCKKLENQTLKKKNIDQYIKQHFIPIKVDKNKSLYPRNTFDAKVVPTVFFIDPKTQKVFHISRGYKSKKKFLDQLEKANSIYNKGEN